MANAFVTWVDTEFAKLKHVKFTWLIESIAKDVNAAATMLDDIVEDIPAQTAAKASLEAGLALIKSSSAAIEASFAGATPPDATTKAA